ncbi:hypothetical protein QYE76_019246 [Lolium multiflorum]|uniref:Uncharacterized protein n=1 Tax=Lolium multiflorum TaxID=4521 RepID=A0AAD8VNW8_LOLMU|nr:hypothetical protein QYE76_019246 [Lolium multiflorum]
MGRSPCCEKAHTNKGAWTKEEDHRLIGYIKAHGEGCWRSLPKAAGLLHYGKSCRMDPHTLCPMSAGMDPHTHRPISVGAAAASGLTTASNTASSFPSSPVAPASRPANALYAAPTSTVSFVRPSPTDDGHSSSGGSNDGPRRPPKTTTPAPASSQPPRACRCRARNTSKTWRAAWSGEVRRCGAWRGRPAGSVWWRVAWYLCREAATQGIAAADDGAGEGEKAGKVPPAGAERSGACCAHVRTTMTATKTAWCRAGRSGGGRRRRRRGA